MEAVDVVERVCFPDFYEVFTDEMIERAFQRYDEVCYIGIYLGERVSIRVKYCYESVRLLLIRNKARVLERKVMELCAKHLDQLLFFAERRGSIEKLITVRDTEIRNVLIVNAIGIFHLGNQGLCLEKILSLPKRLCLKTVREWKIVCFRIDTDIRNIYPYFHTRKEAIEAKRKAPKYLPISEDPLLI